MSADDKEQEEATREKKPKMSKKKKGAIVAGIFLALIVIIAGVVYYMGHRYYTKTNYMTDDEVQALIEKQKEAPLHGLRRGFFVCLHGIGKADTPVSLLH